MVTATVGIVAAVGVVAGASALKAKGLAAIRWWAIPMICLLGLVGMPMAISVSLYPSLCNAAGGVYLAPWITDLWRSIGYLLGLGWVIAVAVVYFGRGVSFACPLRQRFLLLGPVVLLCLSSLFDTLMFFFLRGFDTSHIALESISPDGSRRVLCEEDNWLDTSFAFIVTANVKRPLTCMRLDGTGFVGRPDGERRISWSADSQIMCLWVGNEPVCLYDFVHCELNRPDVSWGNGKSREEAEAEAKAELAEKESAMFAEHGGVAQGEGNVDEDAAPNRVIGGR
ncbi:MAG: hypothetical protein GXY83_19030 [Rhodopirellula sp.]|nr:hypothetical protein [Rhodopirellula sp.]